MGKALYEESIQQDSHLHICSMYDEQEDAVDNPYFPAEYFKGFGISKLQFIREMVRMGAGVDVIILSHVNLLLIGWMIKKVSPHTKLILLAHGIEIWYPLGRRKRNMLHHCNQIIAVSHYTQEQIHTVHSYRPEKCLVLNNCLDPYLPVPSLKEKDPALLEKYGFAPTDFILFTLTRLSSRERYKGYDTVIKVLAQLKETCPAIKYVVGGSYDAEEKMYLDSLIEREGVGGQVVLAGYIEDAELEAHFVLSDLYVMPSRKEGFGIVFIEAMYYGLPVIAGNADGSTDALLNGQLGQLVSPGDAAELSKAITNVMANQAAYLPDPTLLEEHFSYGSYKQNLEKILHGNNVPVY